MQGWQRKAEAKHVKKRASTDVNLESIFSWKTPIESCATAQIPRFFTIEMNSANCSAGRSRDQSRDGKKMTKNTPGPMNNSIQGFRLIEKTFPQPFYLILPSHLVWLKTFHYFSFKFGKILRNKFRFCGVDIEVTDDARYLGVSINSKSS